MLSVSSLRNLSYESHKDILLCSGNSMVLALTSSSMTCLNFCVWYDIGGQGSFFLLYRYPVIPEPFVEEIFHSQLDCFGVLVKITRLHMFESILGLYSIPFSILSPIIHCLDYHSFKKKFWNQVAWVLQFFSLLSRSFWLF